MPVYVDDYRGHFRGMIMSHMTADTLDELHMMADKIGLKREWFQNGSTPHYDVTLSKKELAIRHGAVRETWREGIRRRCVSKERE